MEPELIELSRCRDGEAVAEVCAILDSAGIPYTTGSTAPNFDISTIGSGNDAVVIISVRKHDFVAARSAMENEYLKYALPDDHYLKSFSNEELAEVLGKSSEWSPYDVAHARELAKAKGIDPAEIERLHDEKMDQLRKGKPASPALLICGWVFTLLGGLIGLGIAWSICYMKEKTPDGDFHTYDEKSRQLAKPMLIIASIMLGVGIGFRLLFALES